MMNHVDPQWALVNMDSGKVARPEKVIERHLSDMQDHYEDQQAVREMLAEDPVIYRVYFPEQPSEEIGFYTGTTVIEPGQVGDEYYMTKGHYHLVAEAPEIYLTLKGQGVLILQTRDGQVETQTLRPGTVSYIPGTWAHRMVNTGRGPLAVFAVWPIDAGHDYDSIQKTGFKHRVLEGGEQTAS